MKCRYCNIALAPSRSFVDGEFCCDDHRQRFALEEPFESEGPSATQVSEPVSAALAMLRRKFAPSPALANDLADVACDRVDVDDDSVDVDNDSVDVDDSVADNEPEFLDAELEFEQTAEIPEEEAAELDNMPPELELENELETEPVLEAEEEYAEVQYESVDEETDPLPHPDPHPPHETAASWHWLNAAWKRAPRDLKLVSVLLPVLLVIAVTGSLSKVPVPQLAPQNLGQVQGQVQKAMEDHWKNLNQTISDRAAVAFTDDFRAGLDAWESRSNLTRSWSYDAAGFVRPGPLAVFKPTVDLSDYRFEFLGEIDQKAMGWAFRAEDLNNYYAMKFVVVKPGPLPLVRIVRYAVINGKEEAHVDKPLPITVRADMLYRIQVDARGGDFTIMAQGQVVDFWSDNRLQHGGIGFFSNRGERARLRWVEVSHQYDALGRLCAYLAPYGIEGRNGSIN